MDRFLRKQVRWSGHLLKNFPQFVVIHIVKGFGIVSKAKVDVFLELSCFFNDPADVCNLISGSSAIWKTQQWPQDWKRSVFIPVAKKANDKECSNYHTIALISHASNVKLKILQTRLKQYMNWEFLDMRRCKDGTMKSVPNAQKSPSQASTVHEPWTSTCSNWI